MAAILLLCASGAAAPRPAHAADVAGLVDVNAYVDLEYRETTYGVAPMDLDGFRQAHATVMFTARPVANTLVHLRIETAYGGAADSGALDENGDASIGTGSIVVHGAYAQWTPTPHLRFRAGRMLTPWGFYNGMHDASPTYNSVHVPFSIYHPSLMGGFNSYVQAGTGIDGSFLTDMGNVTVMVTNGTVTDGNEAYRDDNHSRGVVLRLDTDPVRRVSGAASFYVSEVGPEGQEEMLLSAIGTLRTGFGKWETMTEATFARKADEMEAGGYTEVATTLVPIITPFVRAEAFFPDLADGDFRAIVVAGVKAELPGGHIILKLDHLAVLPTSPGTSSGGELRAAVIGWF